MIGAMKKFTLICSLLYAYFVLLISSGSVVHGVEYDYTATAECVEEPWSAHYKGGILVNPSFNKGTEGWRAFGQAKIKLGVTKGGNKFIVAYNRVHSTDSFAQRVQLVKGNIYAFSAWVQVSEGFATLSVAFITPDGGIIYGGEVVAKHGCWSLLKGGIVPDFSGPADLILVAKNTSVEIWGDNFALQPFTENQWRSHQKNSSQTVRNNVVKFQTTNTNKTLVNGALITLRLTNPQFPLGVEINGKILNNTAYQNWFTSRFTITAFGNELKWYSTEKVQGKEDYSVPDAMVQLAEKHNIAVRGHNVVWDNPNNQPSWVPALSPAQLQSAVQKRINSVVLRYKGRLIHWDVVNENLHYHFFEDRLGRDFSSITYGKVHQLDPTPILFMNDFNTIEASTDQTASPENYLSKLNQILAFPGNKDLPAGIGLETRFPSGAPNLAYMRAGLDKLGATNFPIWLTEVFIGPGPNQATFLEQVLREGHAHPAVKGILIWPTDPLGNNCQMCLTDENFHNTQTGDVVDKLLNEWGSKNTEFTLQCDGSCSVSLPLGEFKGTVWNPETNHTTVLNVEVKAGNAESLVNVELH